NTNGKQAAWFNPWRYCVVQSSSKSMVNHAADSEWRVYVLQASRWNATSHLRQGYGGQAGRVGCGCGFAADFEKILRLGRRIGIAFRHGESTIGEVDPP